ncbi:MAG: hypothetical protein ACJ0SL_09010 [Candidatus Rariloculaceae bacterium]
MTRTLLVVLLAASLSSCASRFAATCVDPERYTDNGQMSPIRIPDDLSPPDESNSLQIPPAIEGEVEQLESRGNCLESPPDYYGTEEAPG